MEALEAMALRGTQDTAHIVNLTTGERKSSENPGGSFIPALALI